MNLKFPCLAIETKAEGLDRNGFKRRVPMVILFTDNNKGTIQYPGDSQYCNAYHSRAWIPADDPYWTILSDNPKDFYEIFKKIVDI